MLYPYRESLMSELYPGSQHSTHCLLPAVEAFERCLDLPQAHHHKIIWRLDGGFGGDKNIEQLVSRDYHVLVKGASHRRAASLARQVKRWRSLDDHRAVGIAPTPESFSRPVKTFVLRYQHATGPRHAYLYSSLALSAPQTVSLYDQRGGAETEFRADKSGGGHLHKRRKHKRDAQQVWVLLTDMMHNYLSWFSRHRLIGSPFAEYGPLRITRDLMHVPGLVELDHGRLLSVKLLRSAPHAAELAACLARFWE
jgi:hypothetical protein